MKMNNKKLTKRFFKDNPLNEDSAYLMLKLDLDLYENIKKGNTNIKQMLDKIRAKNDSGYEERLENIKTIDDYVSWIRKGKVSDHIDAIDIALKLPADELLPILLKRFMSNHQDSFLEICTIVFIVSDNKYLLRLRENYDEIKNPYAQSLVCCAFGLAGLTECVDFVYDEYYRFKRLYPCENYEQGPLLSLYCFSEMDA